MSGSSNLSASLDQLEISLLTVPDKNITAQDLIARSTCTLHGWLRKRGTLNIIPGARKVIPWSHRFVVLHQGCLYYYKSETARKPTGAFSLYGYNTVYRAGEVLPAEAPWAFKICHTYEDYKTYYFSASSEQDMKSWMKQIRGEMLKANNRQKQRTKADGQEDEDVNSLTYEDIEKKIYDDPSTLVMGPGAPQAKRADEVSDDEEDESYADSDARWEEAQYHDSTQPRLPAPPTRPRSPRPSPAPIPERSKKPQLASAGTQSFDQGNPVYGGRGVRKTESDRENPTSPTSPTSSGPHGVRKSHSFDQAHAVHQQLNELLRSGPKPTPASKPPNLPRPMRHRPEGSSQKKDTEEQEPHQLPVGKNRARQPSPTIPDEMAPSLPPLSPVVDRSSDKEGADSDNYWSKVFFKESTIAGNASEIIRNIGEEGVYLVRGESSGIGQVLVVFAGNIPKKYRISKMGAKFYLKQDEQFDSIADLLYYYHSQDLPCNVRLKMAYFEHPSHKGK